MLDIQLSGGEPSPIQLTPPWPAPADGPAIVPNDDTSQPGKVTNAFCARNVAIYLCSFF